MTEEHLRDILKVCASPIKCVLKAKGDVKVLTRHDKKIPIPEMQMQDKRC